MIDRVMIIGLRRANTIVPEMEIRQMAGRAGRSYTAGDVGEVVFVVPKEDEKLVYSYMSSTAPNVESSMDNIDATAFHILPAIYCREVYDDMSADKWFSRSFAYFQKKRLEFSQLYDYLIANEMIIGEHTNFQITELGKTSCKFYFRPDRIYGLSQKLAEIVSNEYCDNDFAWTWVLSHQHIQGYVDRELYELYESNVRSLRLRFDNNEQNDGLAYYCMIAGYRPKELKYSIKEKRDDIMRLMNAVKHICKIKNYNIDFNVEVATKMFGKGVNYKQAEYMLKNGIESKSMVRSIIYDEIVT